MTTEEAIRVLEFGEWWDFVSNEISDCSEKSLHEALKMAIAALREQEEREKGCEYCTDCKNIYHLSSGIHDSMDEDVYISGNALVVDIGCHSYGSSVIKFCPMCGRRLPKPTKEDAK